MPEEAARLVIQLHADILANPAPMLGRRFNPLGPEHFLHHWKVLPHAGLTNWPLGFLIQRGSGLIFPGRTSTSTSGRARTSSS